MKIQWGREASRPHCFFIKIITPFLFDRNHTNFDACN